jgi:excisionase family DNA binding protein
VSAKFLTLTQVAERLSTPAATVRYWTAIGKLPAFKPGRQLLVKESDLEAFVDASAVGDQRVVRAKLARAVKPSKRVA